MHTARHVHTPGPPGLASWYVPAGADGFGDRLLMFDNTSTPSLELLRFRAELSATPGFEDALRDRVRRLERFRHDAFAPARAVQYLDDGQTLALVSVHAAGQRLSQMFDQQPRKGLNPAIVSWMLRELTPALADLQSQGDGISHGALTAERIVLAPDGRLRIIEHVLGSALASLERTPTMLWREFNLFTPDDTGGVAGVDAGADVAQLASVALSMLLARPVTRYDLQHRLPALLDEFSELTAAPVSHHVSPLRLWLERALHVNGPGYQSASDAQYDVRQLPSHSDITAVTVSAGVASGDRQRLQRSSEAAPPPRPVLRSVPRSEETVMFDSSRDADAIESFPSEEVSQAPPPAAPVPASAIGGLAAHGFAASFQEEPRRLMPTATQAAATIPSPAAIRTERSRGGLVIAMAGAILAQSVVIGVLVTRPAPSVPSAILIESAQPGDAVMLNGQKIGATPMEVKVDRDLKSLRIIPAPSAPAAKGQPDAASGAKAPPQVAAKVAAAAAAAPRPRNGTVTLVSPLELQVSEGDEALGSTADGALTLPPGIHQLELMNATLNYRRRETVTIKPGQSLSVSLTPPDGLMSINVLPWANCQIGSKLLGETPLANLKVPIGEHEVICRHPNLGELRRTVVVRVGEVARLTLQFSE